MNDPAPPPFDPVRHRRGGRPRKPQEARQDGILSVRLPRDAHAALTARAAASGLSLADFSRAALEGNPVRVTVSQTAPPEVIRQLRIMGGNLRQALELAREGRYIRPSTEAALEEAARTISAELRRLLHGPEC